jgi:hypothetical protein
LRAERREQRITPQQALRGRFAAQDRRFNQRADRRARRLPPWRAWRRGFFAVYVPWYGPLFWPYAYTDVFYSTFWPDAYDDDYWANAYDDFYNGIFFPDGAPYAGNAYTGPYDPLITDGDSTIGISAGADVPGQVVQPVQELCSQAGSGVTAWPFDRIEKAVEPTGEQEELLADLKRAADQAAEQFAKACPKHVPMTPTGRLKAMTERLQATLEAVRLVRPPLETFYQSLSDEQQARFTEIGPSIGSKEQRAARDDAKQDCGGDKAGLISMPIERIEEVVNPTREQGEHLDNLSAAIEKSVQTLENACPNYIPRTPVGRLGVMQQRLEAMLEAANTIHPPLEDFYASLDSEQKARFNRLGREMARSSR